MKINAIGADYSALRVEKNRGVRVKNADPVPNGMSVISFRGGNKDHVLHVVAEADPFAKEGGVATVVKDYQSLNNASATSKGKAVVVMPYYNGLVKYAKPKDKNAADLLKIGVSVPTVPNNLPEGHPLKGKEGQPLFIKPDLSLNKVEDVVKSKKDYFLLEEVSSKTMEWGLQKNAPVKLFKVVANADGTPFKNDVFMVFTEATAYDPKPYSQGQYSSEVKAIVNSWNGDPYAKYDKAVVECMEDISKKMGNFDPGTVVCSDSQAAYTTHYMARKNAEGVEFFKGKKPMQIGHNLGDGYINLTSSRNMMVNLSLFTPQEMEALLASEELRKAIVEGGEDEAKFFNKFLENMQAKNKLSAISVATHYGNTGYLQRFGVVSQGYLDDIVTNKDVAPYMYEDLKDLKAKGVLVGRTNPFNDTPSAFTQTGLVGYDNKLKVKLKNGTEEIIEPIKMLSENDKSSMTLEKMKAWKVEAKKNFLTRFLPKYDPENVESVSSFNAKGNKWESPDKGSSLMRAGAGKKDMPITGGIDAEKYINKLNKGEDVKIVVSWGRGDTQKGLDEVLNGFKKYVQKTGDKDTLLIMGGDMKIARTEGDKVKDLAELISKDELFKGRIMVIDGFAPGKPMAAMADAALFPSRFAPCELTDLEAKKMLCTPIVSNCQGLKQKNFDPAIPSEASMADAYKTRLQFYDSRETFLKEAKQETKDAFNKVFNKIESDIKTKYKLALNEDIPPETFEKFIEGNSDYQIALRKLKDDVMSDQLAECLERRLVTNYNNDVARTILNNQVELKCGWENNAQITRQAQSVGELYRSDFKLDAKDISKDKVIGSNIDKGSLISKGPGKGPEAPGTYTNTFKSIKQWFKAHKKASIIAGSAVGVAALGFAGYKAGWFSPKFEEKKKNGNLSCVG